MQECGGTPCGGRRRHWWSGPSTRRRAVRGRRSRRCRRRNAASRLRTTDEMAKWAAKELQPRIPKQIEE
eukprot:11222970-Lingulodinium_polyedra.AAC.1